MAENSKIEWCHHTFNGWIGCTKVSAGCANCYAETQDNHRKWTPEGWGKGKPRQRTSAAYWREPLKWNKAAEGAAERPRVFCASLADVFDDEVPDEWRADLFTLIDRTPNLDWMLLTKRPQNIMPMMNAIRYGSDEDYPLAADMPLPNVWFGTSVENQAAADERIPALLGVPARARFLSCEPLLGPVDLSVDTEVGILTYLQSYDFSDEPTAKIDLVIAGGESGNGARPMHPDWARSLRDQCFAAGVSYFFKQYGEWKPVSQMTEQEIDGVYHPAPVRKPEATRRCLVETTVLQGDGSTHDPYSYGAYLQGTTPMMMFKVGKKKSGRLLDGREWNEMPKVEI